MYDVKICGAHQIRTYNMDPKASVLPTTPQCSRPTSLTVIMYRPTDQEVGKNEFRYLYSSDLINGVKPEIGTVLFRPRYLLYRIIM